MTVCRGNPTCKALNLMALEQRLAGLSLEEIEAYLEQRKQQS